MGMCSIIAINPEAVMFLLAGLGVTVLFLVVLVVVLLALFAWR